MSRYFSRQQSIDSRRAVLTQLRAARSWVALSKIEQNPKVERPRMILNALVELRLVETRQGNNGSGVEAKITRDGLIALKGETFTSEQLGASLRIQMYDFRMLREIAKELDIVRTAGPGAGKVGAITGLLRGIVDRREAFVRWFKYAYAYPLESDE